MSAIKFGTEEKAQIVSKIQLYFSEELNQKIGQFDAEFLLDFFSEEIGGYYYNQGLYDAQTALASKLDEIQEAISELEKVTDFRR